MNNIKCKTAIELMSCSSRMYFHQVGILPDDIVEAYKQLRRLVMEYLGIGAPTPSISDAGPSNPGSTIDKEGTMDTMITGQSNLVRQWSKHSITDSLSQAISNLKVRSAPSPMPTTGRGIVVSTWFYWAGCV